MADKLRGVLWSFHSVNWPDPPLQNNVFLCMFIVSEPLETDSVSLHVINQLMIPKKGENQSCVQHVNLTINTWKSDHTLGARSDPTSAQVI